MAFIDDITYIRNRCNRILNALNMRSQGTFSINPSSDVDADGTFPITQAMLNNLDGKIATVTGDIKTKAATLTYP